MLAGFLWITIRNKDVTLTWTANYNITIIVYLNVTNEYSCEMCACFTYICGIDKTTRTEWNNTHQLTCNSLRARTQFRGAYHFQYSLRQLASLAEPYRLSDCEVEVHASVGERYIDVIVDGFSKARIVNDSIAVTILGEKPLIFKPHMEFYVYVSSVRPTITVSVSVTDLSLIVQLVASVWTTICTVSIYRADFL